MAELTEDKGLEVIRTSGPQTIRARVVAGNRELVLEPVGAQPGTLPLIRIKVAGRDGQGLSITVPAEIVAELIGDVAQQKWSERYDAQQKGLDR